MSFLLVQFVGDVREVRGRIATPLHQVIDAMLPTEARHLFLPKTTSRGQAATKVAGARIDLTE